MHHYDDVIMGTSASQITSLAIVYSIVYSSADQRKHQSSASLAFVRGIHRAPVNSPHKWPVTRKMFPFDDVVMMKGDVCHLNFTRFSNDLQLFDKVMEYQHSSCRDGHQVDTLLHPIVVTVMPCCVPNLPRPNRINSLNNGRRGCSFNA